MSTSTVSGAINSGQLRRLATALLTLLVMAVTQVGVAAPVIWQSWTFDYDVSGDFDGLSLRNVTFQGRPLITKLSLPVMRVFYDSHACGPYADRLGGTLSPIPWANDATLAQREFTLNGQQWYEIGIRDQIGNYDIYQVYYLSADGTLDAHIYSKGLQCVVNHIHYPDWRIDFGLDGVPQDQILRDTGSGFEAMTSEFDVNVASAPNHAWRVRDAITGLTVDVLPGFPDFVIPDGNTNIPVTSYANNNVFGRIYRGSEDTGWTYGPNTQVPFNDGEGIASADTVLWYEGFLPHSSAEGSALWHSTGFRLVANLAGTPPPQPPPPGTEGTQSFTGGGVSISDDQSGVPYPSLVSVSGMGGVISKVTVRLDGLSHTFPDDVDIALVGPFGQAVMLMSDAGGSADLNGVSLTFDSSAAPALPDASQVLGGVFRPMNYGATDAFAAPAPGGTYGTSLGVFDGQAPNGTWRLYVVDDAGTDVGSIGSWVLTVTTTSTTPPPPDSTPDTFSFTDVSGAIPGTVQTSNTVTISGINTAAPISVVGGEYAIGCGATFTAAAGTISNGQTVCVRHTSAATTATNTDTTLTVGGVGDTFRSTTFAEPPPPDSTPEPFAFADVSGAIPGTVQTSNTVTITGINTAAPISVVGGEYAIGCGATFTAAAGTISNGQTVCVRHTSAATTATGTDTTLTVGGVGDTFTSTTFAEPPPPDSTPGPFAFTDVIDVLPETVLISNTVTITGINTAAPISVVGGEYAIGCGATFTAAAGTISNGQTVCVRHTSAATTATNTDTTLTVGGVGDTFRSTTPAAPPPPGTEGTQSFTGGVVAISDNQPGVPYPSLVSVSGMGGVISKVTVRLDGLSHTYPDDVDIALVGPFGQAVMLMSDAGGSADLNGVSLTFDSTAAPALPDGSQLLGGVFRPMNYEGTDAFAAPAPGGPYGTSLGVFDGQAPNGTWRLYVVDDAGTDVGSIGSWVLTVTTTSTTPPPPDSTPDTFSFTDVSGAIPGTVQTSNTVTISGINTAAPISVVGGEYAIGCGATFTAAAGTISNGQTVCVRHTSAATTATNTDTTLTVGGVGDTFRSTTFAEPPPPGTGGTQSFTGGAVSVLDNQPGSPYPSTVNVSNLGGTIAKVTVRLDGLSHTFPDDLDIALVGPGGQVVMLMSDAGGSADLNGVSLTLDSSAAPALPDTAQVSGGVFRPMNYEATDAFAAPAPGGPYGTSLGVFDGQAPNGTWRLYVVDDAGVDVGSIGSWVLTITTQ